MNQEILYYDRASGCLKTEAIHAGGFLFWSYNTAAGRKMTETIFRYKPITKFYGWIHKTGLSRYMIKPFVEKMQVDMGESLAGAGVFHSFNDFFTREIDLSKRAIQRDPDVCISPVDGKLLVYPTLGDNRSFQIKRHVFHLHGFLRDSLLTKKFVEGSMVVCRLCLADYHHFHFPDSGIPGAAQPIPGHYYAGGPYSLSALIPFYSENYRMLSLFKSDHFGELAIVEVGAFTVGSIRQCYVPGLRVTKGSHKGYFELGGSTVVLLFEKGAIHLDLDLCENTEKNLETYVRFGDTIGRVQR